MKKIKSILCILAMVTMVLESKIAAQGIRDGIELCINSVIPALFPFIILSSMFSSMDISFLQKPLRPLERLCRFPMGCGQLFLLGLLGGYPSGAQMIAQAWEDEKLSKQNASRMLGFCNNAGPAFIFGIGLKFLNIHCVWTVWLIHITSAIVVGIILPGKNPNISLIHNMKEKSFSLALEQSIKTMAIICSWIILFRMFINILTCRFAGYLTQTAYCLICGVLEITNGIYALSDLTLVGTRFILFTTFLSAGGLCVAMQTMSITKKLGTGQYFPGKILQASIAFLLSTIAQHFVCSEYQTAKISVYHILIAILIILLTCAWGYGKITVAFLKNMMYNTRRIHT